MRRIGGWAWAWAALVGVSAFLAGAAVGAGVVIAAFTALAACLIPLGIAARRHRARSRAVSHPFPQKSLHALEKHVGYYRNLSSQEQQRFREEVQWFLHRQNITGPRAQPLDDELRALVAASAVMLSFGRQGFEWPVLRDIIVYPEAFNEDYQVQQHGPRLGEVGHQGPIVFSARALKDGFARASDGHHVGLHEFAHVLDLEDGMADGVPSMMPWPAIEQWMEVMHREARRVRRHDSLLNQYASKDNAEFFAVATEAFFEQSEALKKRHPELYACLRKTYGQDPPRG